MRVIRELTKNKSYYLMMLPAIVIVFLFSYLPFPGMMIAFKNFKLNEGIWNSPWAGLDNFKFFFTSDYALKTTLNTIWINLNYMVWGTLVSVTLALMLNEIIRKRAVKIYQNAMFLPFFLSAIIVARIVNSIVFSIDSGIANSIITFFGFEKVLWHNTPGPWKAIIIATHTWQVMGYNVIIYLATIAGMDEEMYEAASLDGAGRLQKIFRITLPMLVPAIITLALLSIGRMLFGDFGLIYALTDEKPLLISATDIIETYVYRSVRKTNDFGTSSAIGLYQSFVGFILVFGSNFLAKKFDKDYGLF